MTTGMVLRRGGFARPCALRSVPGGIWLFLRAPGGAGDTAGVRPRAASPPSTGGA